MIYKKEESQEITFLFYSSDIFLQIIPMDITRLERMYPVSNTTNCLNIDADI